MRCPEKSPEGQAKAIESKRRLLAYLQGNPRHLSIESYLCLTRILDDAGWLFIQERWSKNGRQLTTLQAAIAELDQQIAADCERLLCRTVMAYGALRRNEAGRS